MSVLDRLLGRASLQARIDDLEEENERLRTRFEAESERRSAAVTARQRAEERQNRLEDRIAQLEGDLEAADGDAEGLDFEVRRRARVRGDRLVEVLDRLESVQTGPEGALTATVDDSVPEAVADALGERAPLVDEVAPCLVCTDDEGLVSVALSSPLVPTVDPTWSDRFAIERRWFLPDRTETVGTGETVDESGTYLLALVRADLFALGVYDGRDRLEYRGFESDVKGAHSKGGFSQARFERIRDGQIDEHLDRCREAIEARAGDGHPLYLVGQRDAVAALAETVDADAAATVDATGDPESALEDAFRSFFTTELCVL